VSELGEHRDHPAGVLVTGLVDERPCLGVAGGGTADERVERPAVLGHERDEATEGVLEPGERFEFVARLGGVQHRVAGGADDGLVQALLRAEVVEEQTPGDPGVGGEPVDRDVLEGFVHQGRDPQGDELRTAFLGAEAGALAVVGHAWSLASGHVRPPNG
jgi:hypothetical protein